jgi:hypothetical protein
MTLEDQVELVKRHNALNIAGNPEAAEQLLTDDFVIEVVDSTLDGQEGPPLRVREVNRITDGVISDITPFYFDPAPWIAAGERRKAAKDSAAEAGRRVR